MFDMILPLVRAIPTVPPVPLADVVTATDHWWVGFILWCPLISLVLCGLVCGMPSEIETARLDHRGFAGDVLRADDGAGDLGCSA